MARPRKDQEGPSAKERLEAAYWELLAEGPSESISVKELIARARVNRNTFYYHYADIDEMAVELIAKNLPREFFGTFLRMIACGDFNTRELREIGNLDEHFARVQLILRHGSPRLIGLGKEEVLACLLEMIGTKREELTKEDLASVDFIWGGVSSLMAGEQVHCLDDYLDALEGGIAAAVSPLLLGILKRHSRSSLEELPVR